jgi:dihydroneopterin aldolase
MALQQTGPFGTVFIHGLEAYGYHGVPDAEQEIGHRYRVSLELKVPDCSAAESDDVAGTVDYGAVAKQVTQIIQTHQYRTVERLAQVIADAILQEFLKVQEVRITVGKPFPPAPVIVAEVGCELVVVRGATARENVE